MAEIKIKPVFEWLDGKWKLITLDCPKCGGEMEPSGGIKGGYEGMQTRCYRCSCCRRILEWYPFRYSPSWRISQ